MKIADFSPYHKPVSLRGDGDIPAVSESQTFIDWKYNSDKKGLKHTKLESLEIITYYRTAKTKNPKRTPEIYYSQC